MIPSLTQCAPGRVRRAAALAALWVLAVCLAAPALAGNGARAAYVFADEPLPPYTSGEVGGLSRGGVTHELLNALFRRLGASYEIRLMPWARAVKSVQYGRADGIPLLMKTREREDFLVYSDPIVENRERFYYLPERLATFQWRDFEDLGGFIVGLVGGYAYDEGFLEAVRTGRVVVLYSEDTETNIRKLLAGRVDLALEDESSLGGLLRRRPEWAARIRAARRPVSRYDWHMGVSRRSPLAERMDEINRALTAMRADGSLKAILDRR